MDRIIAKLANQFYLQIPEHARRWISIEDLIRIGEWRVESRRCSFDPERSSLTTWKYLVVRSCFQDLVRASKRDVVYVEMPEHWDVGREPSFAHVGARRRVERFLSLASPALRRLLENGYFSGSGQRGLRANSLERYSAEARMLSRQSGAQAEDFRQVRLCLAH